MTQHEKPTDAEAVEALANCIRDCFRMDTFKEMAEFSISELRAQGFEIVRVK